jgi:transmembrane sensor
MASAGKTTPSATARAEAAAWVARLHGPNRTPEVEAGLRRWLSEDPERAAALELMTETWEKSAMLVRGLQARRPPREHRRTTLSFGTTFWRAACAAIVLIVVFGTVAYLRTDAVSTGVGEQRTLVLEDGSRIVLNTASRAVVDYDRHVRRVRLERGEALFEVAQHPNWPFVVSAAGREVRALGTAFVVRKEEGQDLVVTLVEGKVTVGRNDETAAPPSEMSGSAVVPERSAALFTLSPGQRLTLASSHPPRIDRPSLERVTAWQRGQVVLDETRLADAVAEMNRYSRTRLVIEDPVSAGTPISGIFRAGDSDSFAAAVAKTYHLEIRATEREIVLTGRAAAN